MKVSSRTALAPAVTIASDADYKAALKLMQENALHHLPVVDADGNLVGMAAERDLLLAASHYLQSAVEIGDIMHRGVVTVPPEMPVSEAASLMIDKRIGGLPVVDEDVVEAVAVAGDQVLGHRIKGDETAV